MTTIFTYRLTFLIWLFFNCFSSIYAQKNEQSDNQIIPNSLTNDQLEIVTNVDTISQESLKDSIAYDSSSYVSPPVGDIKMTINYSARDSINFLVNNEVVMLYGDAKIKYGDIELEADIIKIDYENNTLSANGRIDSLGRKLGFPIFKNGTEVYETKDIVYNFKTGKAKISQVVTQQGEGFLHGEVVYKNDKNELFSIDNAYTTCNLSRPHFRIRAKKTKMIPNDKIVLGPANLEINDVPTLFWLPFGMFPSKQEVSSSGILFPTYGEESRRGFFLRNGGYFFDISEYIKLRITGDIYSKGGHGINLNTNYNKRYSYRGGLNFSYTNIKLSDKIEDTSSQNDFRLTWNHSPQSKGNSRFSANVNAATSTYNQNNFLGINGDPANNRFDNITRQLSSSVSYSKSFGSSPFTLGISARHNQDIRTREIDLLLPSFTLNMTNIYPLASKSGLSPQWMEKLNLRYSAVGSNQITNNLGRIGINDSQDSIAPFNVENLGSFFQNAKRGVRHTIPLSTSFKLFKHFTMSQSLSYQEIWYFRKLIWDLDSENRPVVADTLNGFNRIYTYGVSNNVNTRLYGTYFFKKGKIQAIRHVMNPSVSFNYTPDFSAEKYGYFQTLTTTENEEVQQSHYQSFLYGSPSKSESASIGFSVNNTLELKVKTKNDTLDNSKSFEKVAIFKNFGLSTSYNLIAESYQLSDLRFRANTSVFDNKLSINFNGSIDPYTYVIDSVVESTTDKKIYDRKIDLYAWRSGNGFGQLSQLTIALGTSLNPKARNKENTTVDKINNSNLSQADKDYLINNSNDYVDFDVPWNLRLNYSLSYSKRGFQDSKTTQSLQFSGDLSLTEKWKVTFRSGYDFERKQFTTTQLTVNRDLHCWQMNFNWTPFGVFQSYSFTIRVKSSLLQDLKIDRNRSFFDSQL